MFLGDDGDPNSFFSAKKRKTEEQQQDASVEILFHSAKEDEGENGTTITGMDGVDYYLPSRTMTAEERACHRLPKRKQDVTASNTESVILMEGKKEVWQDDFGDVYDS